MRGRLALVAGLCLLAGCSPLGGRGGDERAVSGALGQEMTLSQALGRDDAPRGLGRLFAARGNAARGGLVSRAGSVCGVPGIKGEALPPISNRVNGCGLENPVRVTEVAGLALSAPAVIDCNTARALHNWADRGAIPVVGRRGGGLTGLQVAASYTCRTRNSQAGARISEHGRGRAVDISALILANGERITVEEGWGRGQDGRILRRLHRAACGPFGTVLGPESDVFHRDHFHFDTARYRSGAYCR